MHKMLRNIDEIQYRQVDKLIERMLTENIFFSILSGCVATSLRQTQIDSAIV